MRARLQAAIKIRAAGALARLLNRNHLCMGLARFWMKSGSDNIALLHY